MAVGAAVFVVVIVLGVLCVVVMAGVRGFGGVVMLVRLEGASSANRQEADAGRVLERDAGGFGRQRVDRPREPGVERRSDPDHQPGLLQELRLGRAERVAVRRGAGWYHEARCPDPRHDPGDDRLDRRDIGRDDRRRRRGCSRDRGEPQNGSNCPCCHECSLQLRHLWPDTGPTRMPTSRGTICYKVTYDPVKRHRGGGLRPA